MIPCWISIELIKDILDFFICADVFLMCCAVTFGTPFLIVWFINRSNQMTEIEKCIDCNYIGCGELQLALTKVKQLKVENKELKEKIEALVRVNERLCNKISELEGKNDRD